MPKETVTTAEKIINSALVEAARISRTPEQDARIVVAAFLNFLPQGASWPWSPVAQEIKEVISDAT